jgi:hypothetical protein
VFPGGGLLAFLNGRVGAGLLFLFIGIAVYSVIAVTAAAIWNEICAAAGAVFGWLGWH